MIEAVGYWRLFRWLLKLVLQAVELVLHLLQVILVAALQLSQLKIDLLKQVVVSTLHNSASLFFLPLAAFSELL